jgi:hypothetical protein
MAGNPCRRGVRWLVSRLPGLGRPINNLRHPIDPSGDRITSFRNRTIPFSIWKNPSPNPLNPLRNPMNPAGNPMNPFGNPMNPFGNPMNPFGNPMNPFGNPMNPSANPMNPFGNPMNPSGNPMNPFGKGIHPFIDRINLLGTRFHLSVFPAVFFCMESGFGASARPPIVCAERGRLSSRHEERD